MKPCFAFFICFFTFSLSLSAQHSIQIEKDVVYGKVNGRELKIDLAFPKQESENPRPVVVWIHGGAWRAGSKDRNRAQFLARHGFFTASVEYRLTGEAIWPAQIHDCKAAIRFLKANAKPFNLDPNKIGVWGSSAGGHLVAMLGATAEVEELEGNIGPKHVTSRVHAVVDFYGPTDLTVMGDFPSRMDHDAPDSPESQLLGGPPKQNRAIARTANPITYITKDDPPFLIVHGDLDRTVPYNQSQILHKALTKAGVDSTFIPVRGGGHGGWSKQTMPTNQEIRKRVVAFFIKKLTKNI